ncbi:MAG: hypothetical protein Ct9H90mP27_2510 [Gammaproteobacteria bacterium]|nr:MAG: hypothetical protein Ct9H90mP27_2510 [Gammaproteobacteria bacterium]
MNRCVPPFNCSLPLLKKTSAIKLKEMRVRYLKRKNLFRCYNLVWSIERITTTPTLGVDWFFKVLGRARVSDVDFPFERVLINPSRA